MNNALTTNREEMETPRAENRKIELRAFERSPKLAEIRAVYKSRRKFSERTTASGPSDVEAYLREIWNPRALELSEDFIVLCLNGSHQVIGWVKVSSGGLNASHVDARIVFAVALQTASTAIVLAHNHPSGNLEPSMEDKNLTRRLVDAGSLLGVRVLDHVILTREGSFSFADHGLM